VTLTVTAYFSSLGCKVIPLFTRVFQQEYFYGVQVKLTKKPDLNEVLLSFM